MRVGALRVRRLTEQRHVRLVGRVEDGDHVLVGAEADLLALVLRVGAGVDDALAVVGVTRRARARLAVEVRKAAGERRVGGVANVNGVEAGRVAIVRDARRVRRDVPTDGIGETRLLVDDNVVRVEDRHVDGRRLDVAERVLGEPAERGEIQHLHPMW